MIKDTKDATEKFRLSSDEKAAIRHAAKLVNISISVLIRLCLTSEHHVKSKPDALKAAAVKRP